MPNKPILSICISTYNRENFLKQLIDNIINQKGFSSDVEICIYNDPSSDNTQSMVEEYMKKYSNIKYHRNETRIGMIPSILNVAQMGSGEYTWLFSDDDIMDSNAIDIMLDIIKKEKPSLILNKFFGFKNDNEINSNINKSYDGKISTHKGLENLFNYFSDLKYSIDGYMMHCSLFCFKKELFINNLNLLLDKYGKDYIDTLKKDFFAHIKIIYLPFGNTQKIILVEKNLVLLRAGNISWNFVFKTCTDYNDLINDLKKVYSINKKTYRKMKILYYYSVFTYIVIVHIQRYLPKKLYNFFVNMGKKLVKIIKIG